jgi:hypothetical protein
MKLLFTQRCGGGMELQTSANGKKNPQRSTSIAEEISFISDAEARKKSSRLYISDEIYTMYCQTFNRLREDRGEWCQVKTDDYARKRRLIKAIAKRTGAVLIIQKSVVGLQYRLATEEEAHELKATGERLVADREARKEKK